MDIVILEIEIILFLSAGIKLDILEFTTLIYIAHQSLVLDSNGREIII